MKLLTRLFQLPIHLYRYTLSYWLGGQCRFAPTCSLYALEALEVHGPVKGMALALRRLARCHPVTWLGGGGGFDPVPPRASVTHAHSPEGRRSCHNPSGAHEAPGPISKASS